MSLTWHNKLNLSFFWRLYKIFPKTSSQHLLPEWGVYVGLPEKGKPIALQLVSAAQSW
jgi:hypothetical protein